MDGTVVTDQIEKLHIGCGSLPLEGWCNVDIQSVPGVDVVLDVRDGLPGSDVRYIYAEHFIEHLALDDARRFLAECRRVLRRDGTLRLSTPNLDWVMLSHYRFGRWLSNEDAIADCLQTNLAFHGWGHQFLYNFTLMAELLRCAGFAEVRSRAYGESDDPALRGLERHPPSPDWPGLPHVVIVEATGVGKPGEPSVDLSSWRDAMGAR